MDTADEQRDRNNVHGYDSREWKNLLLYSKGIEWRHEKPVL